ncbi:MAG: hypothetical protein U0R52_11150 [Solirubrobacterales bacterium]
MSALLLMAAVAVAGCGGGGDSTPTEGGGGLDLTYHRSGGVAATDRTLRIHPDGSASVAVRTSAAGPPIRAQFAISAAESGRLASALGESGFDSLEAKPPSGGCADCYVYELSTPANSVRFDDVTEPAALAPVIRQLDTIVVLNTPSG